MFKHTKILATFGPAVASAAQVRRLVKAGVNAFRVNCSHGSRSEFEAAVAVIRKGTSGAPFPVGIMFDISGLKLRLARFEGRLVVRRGDRVTLTSGAVDLAHKQIGVNHPEIVRAVKKSHRVFIDDGKLMFEVIAAGNRSLTVRALNDGELLSAKGINLPDSQIALPSITAKDKQDLRSAVELGADYVALSFVRSAADIAEARRIISRAGGQQKIIAKLEKGEAIHALEEIMLASDGVMVARGDLGVELPPSELPRTQKQIIALANRLHKPVLVATQMLESMRFSPRATRAEINDVASAVFDFADVVMLSAETASGQYPVESVQTMTDVILATEPAARPRMLLTEERIVRSASTLAIAQAVSNPNSSCPIKVICSYTTSGYTPEVISNLFPPVPILALTPFAPVARQMALYRSIYACLIRQPKTFEEMIRIVNREVLRHRLAQKGELVAITGGYPFGSTVPTNILKYHVVE